MLAYLAVGAYTLSFCMGLEKTFSRRSTVKTELLDFVESKNLKKELPHFEVGDTVEVYCRTQEGDKVRTQIFTGTVIARKGRGINASFTVRRIVNNEGVERLFPMHSPNVLDVKPIRSGKTRRAKLYFLRDRTGKSVKLAQRHSEHTAVKDAKDVKNVKETKQAKKK
jgi:large subunit ribosomal protein L19